MIIHRLCFLLVASIGLTVNGETIALGQTKEIFMSKETLTTITTDISRRFRPQDALSVFIKPTSGASPHISFSAWYSDQTLSWHLPDPHHPTNERNITLCIDDRLPYRTLTVSALSSSDARVVVSISVIDITLYLDEPKLIAVSPGSPQTFLIDQRLQQRDRLTFDAEATDEASAEMCMMVAVYDKGCPLKTDLSNVKTAQMFLTALSQATVTIHAQTSNFVEPFYISIVVLPNDDPCHEKEEGPEEGAMSTTKGRPLFSPSRLKHMNVKIMNDVDYPDYTIPMVLPIVFLLFMTVITVPIIACRQYEKPSNNDGGEAVDETDVQEEEYDGLPKSDSEPARFLIAEMDSRIKNFGEDNRRVRVRNGLHRLRRRPRVADLTRISSQDKWFRRNRSRVYVYLVPLLSLFYFIPAIQFAFLSKEVEGTTGNQDLCFHNFRCSRSWWIFHDFNHVWSNISYAYFGILFMVLVWIKSCRLPKDLNPKNEHEGTKTGVPQQLSLFYAMGFALFAQGAFSICYHVCPTNLSLQFDTTMMCIICMLCCVKIYQFRHPDATANAFSTFALLGGIVLLEALGIYTHSLWVYVPFFFLYISITIFIAIDCYFIGVGRLDRRLILILCTHMVKCSRPKYPLRFSFSLIFTMANFIYAAYTWYKLMQGAINISHVVLVIMGINLMLYLGYYMLRKTGERGFLKHCLKCYNDATDGTGAQACCVNCINSGFFMRGRMFTFLAIALGIAAMTFYLDRSANRNLTAAESRQLNEWCTYADFYDSHDMWHFFGAAAVFCAFIAMLTIDDDLLHVTRDQIDVF